MYASFCYLSKYDNSLGKHKKASQKRVVKCLPEQCKKRCILQMMGHFNPFNRKHDTSCKTYKKQAHIGTRSQHTYQEQAQICTRSQHTYKKQAHIGARSWHTYKKEAHLGSRSQHIYKKPICTRSQHTYKEQAHVDT